MLEEEYEVEDAYIFDDEKTTLAEKADVLRRVFRKFGDVESVCGITGLSRATILRLRMYLKLDPVLQEFINDNHLGYKHVSAINRSKNNRYALEALLAEIKTSNLTGDESLAYSDLTMIRHGRGDTAWTILRGYSKGKIIPMPYLSELSYGKAIQMRERLFEILADVEALCDAANEAVVVKEKALVDAEDGTKQEEK